MIKLIIFDLWQTLAYRDVDYSTTTRMLEEAGVDIPKKDFVKIFESSVQTRRWEGKYAAYENLAKNMGLEITEENVRTLMKIRDDAEAQTKLYPHVFPMLKKLRELGYKIGIISNSSEFAIEQVRKRADILRYIDYPVFSFEVGVIKPDLKIFERMLEISNCNPEETIMVGDKLDDDVEPPRSIGMNAIRFLHKEENGYDKLKKDLASFGVIIE